MYQNGDSGGRGDGGDRGPGRGGPDIDRATEAMKIKAMAWAELGAMAAAAATTATQTGTSIKLPGPNRPQNDLPAILNAAVLTG